MLLFTNSCYESYSNIIKLHMWFFIKPFNPVTVLGEEVFGMEPQLQKEAGFVRCASSVPCPSQVTCCVWLTQASCEDLVPFKRIVFPRRSITLRLLMQDTPQTLISCSDAAAPWKGGSCICRSSCCTAEEALPSQLVCSSLKVCLHHFQWDALSQRDAVNYRSCYYKFKQKC